MKHTSVLFLLTFFSLLLVSCVEKSKKSSSTTTTDPYYCSYNPTASGCSATVTCNPPLQGQTQCANYCQYHSCSGTTTGTTTGGTSNPYPYIPTIPVNPNWDVHYPGGVPTPSVTCATATNPSDWSQSYSPYETRKATMTIVGQQPYDPASSDAAYYNNTSSLLKTTDGAYSLFTTDTKLKVRFKVNQQPDSAKTGQSVCYGRKSGASTVAGYTKLHFNVKIRGRKADGSIGIEPVGYYTVEVNSCSVGIDLSSYKAYYPRGVHVIISDVMSNTGQYPSDYASYGWKNSSAFTAVPTTACWSIEMEVAADGTKTFN